MLIGDMAIKNLAPRDTNSGGRIVKNMRICGSGLYEYHKTEAALMGLDPTQCPGDTFKVYRSPEVLKANKDLYSRVPIITGRHVRVNTGNAKQLVVGMVGDVIQDEVGDDGETYLYATGTIVAEDGIQAYQSAGQLSVGYDPIVEWCAGDYKGEHYDAVLKGFNEINHLLICTTARGGPQCMIMDSIEPVFEKILRGGTQMNIFKKIFGPSAKPIAGDAKVASALLQSVKAGADAATQVKAVTELLGDAVDDTLKGYLEELAGDAAKADKESLGKAVDTIDQYVQKMLGDAEPPKDDKEPPKEEPPKNDEPPTDKKEEKEPPIDKQDKKENPTTGDSLDYDKLATLVAEKLRPAAEPQVGDSVAVSELMTAMGGDSKTELSSDSLLKAIF